MNLAARLEKLVYEIASTNYRLPPKSGKVMVEYVDGQKLFIPLVFVGTAQANAPEGPAKPVPPPEETLPKEPEGSDNKKAIYEALPEHDEDMATIKELFGKAGVGDNDWNRKMLRQLVADGFAETTGREYRKAK